MLTYDKYKEIIKKMMICYQYKPQYEGEAKELIETYYKGLSKLDITDELLAKVSGRLLYSWKPEYGNKFPPLSDFVDLAGVSPSSIAKKAHKVIKNRILRVGGYEPLDLGKEHKHFVAMEAIRKMGGWFAVCQQGIEQWDKNNNRFSKLFEDLYYEKVPHKPLLCGSDLKNQEFLAEYNKNQIENN